MKNSTENLMQPHFSSPIHSDFSKLFFRKEGKEILGKNAINLLILIGILFITFVAIGFANGSLDYLNDKMNDPFINWVSIEVPYRRADAIAEIRTQLNQDSISERFDYQSVTGHFSFSLQFWNSERKGTFQAVGRTIEYGNPILTKILDDENLLQGRAFRSVDDVGLIVTEKFLKDFKYDEDVAYVLMSQPITLDKDALLPLPVIAVVKELPGLNSFAATPYFRSQRIVDIKANNPFHPKHTRELILFSQTDSVGAYKFRDALKSFFSKNSRYANFDPMFSVQKNSLSYQTGYNVSVSFYPELPQNQLDSLFQQVKKCKQLADFDFTRFYNYRFYSVENHRNYDYLSVNFISLEKVREFKNYLAKTAHIQIDVAQIDAKENYHFVSQLTLIISLILIIFSVLSVCLFTSHILMRHLEKIKTNIGTFKAFGMDNESLQKIYIYMVYRFMFKAIAYAFVAAFLYGSMGGGRLILMIGGSPEANYSYFELFNKWTFAAVFVLIIISFVVLSRTAKLILNKTPGDLIYNRA